MMTTIEEGKLSKRNLMCCLLEESVRCRQTADSAHYSQRIKRRIRRLNLRLKFDSRARHNFICNYHKRMIQMHRDHSRTSYSDLRYNGYNLVSDANNYNLSDANGYNLVSDANGYNLSHANGYNLSDANGYAECQGLKLAFHKLSFKTLCKYKRLFNIITPHGINKYQLAETLLRHFKTIPVDEHSILTTFVTLLNNRGNSVDHRKVIPSVS